MAIERKPRPRAALMSPANSGDGDDVRRISVRLSQRLKDRLPTCVTRDGYGMRGKSQWVAEAVVSLLRREGWEGALLAERVAPTDSQETFQLPADLVQRIQEEVRRVDQAHPSLHASQSTIVRAAINRRMLGIYHDAEKSEGLSV